MRIAFWLSATLLLTRCASAPAPVAPQAEAARRAVIIAIRPNVSGGDPVEMIVMGADGRAISLVQPRDGFQAGDVVTLLGDSPVRVVPVSNSAH